MLRKFTIFTPKLLAISELVVCRVKLEQNMFKLRGILLHLMKINTGEKKDHSQGLVSVVKLDFLFVCHSHTS